MHGIELVPFSGYYKGFGSPSCDSVVGTVKDKGQKKWAVKWNRKHIATEQEAFETCRFVRKTIDLCEAALGKEFVVPSLVAEGAKKDGDITKYKVYIAQPFIEGWTAKDFPKEITSDVMDRWNVLNSRLFALYNAAYYVNGRFGSKPSCVFPLTLTVGSSRKQALIGEPGGNIPHTPNLIISKEDHSLKICDFGEYIPWNDSMDRAYNQILERVKNR